MKTIRQIAHTFPSRLSLGLLLLGSVVALPGFPSEKSPPSEADLIVADEEDLTYEVSWAVFKLGTIRLKTFRSRAAEAYIDSYDNIPFVNLHSVHYTWMDSLLFSRGSRALELRDDEWWGLDYIYDIPNTIVRVEETYQKDLRTAPHSRVLKDSIQLADKRFADGLSIAYLSRRLAHTKQTFQVHTILYGKIGVTTFNLPGNHVSEALSVLDRPVKAVEITGTTSVEGIFGMTGDFRGWFSDDSVAVPLKGKIKVLLGNVNIELIQWDRNGWNPPE
jgi:hypothetical protein